jgi:protein-S-isoprenylcysteine O-methyltransferase Ste14
VNTALFLMLIRAIQFLFAVAWRVATLNSGRALQVVGCFWIVLAVYWAVSALSQKSTKKEEHFIERLRHVVPMMVAVLLLSQSDASYGWLGLPFVAESGTLNLLGLVLAGAGAALAIWARWHLGRNWSAVVSIREQHDLIRSGPYRAVRHPIYTGLLLAILGTVLIIGEFRALVALAIVLASFYLKARKEDVWLAREFGETFEGHAKHTGMFLPRFWVICYRPRM